MGEEEKMEKIVKNIIKPLSIENILRLKGYKLTNKTLCNSAGVWENRDEHLAIVFYETQ